MNNEENRAILKNFFAAYFHQDWYYDANSTEEVVADYISVVEPEEARRLAMAILDYIAIHVDEKDLADRLFTKLGCYYLPSADGLSFKTWLNRIAEQLLASIDSNPYTE